MHSPIWLINLFVFCSALTYLADQLSELIQVALALWSDAQLSDASVELLCSLKGVLHS